MTGKMPLSPITPVIGISVPFAPNDILLARRPIRPGSPYVRAFNPFQPCPCNAPLLTPFGSQASGYGPSWTQVSDAAREVVPVQRSRLRPSESAPAPTAAAGPSSSSSIVASILGSS